MKITKRILGKMEEMRRNGASYKVIAAELGVSKWSCIHYLRDVEIEETSAVEEEWKEVEIEAAQMLGKHGFTRIINLNKLCPTPYWDYYAEKDDEKWLIDVTINSRKDVGEKISRMIEDHRAAILLKRGDDWEFFEINMRKAW